MNFVKTKLFNFKIHRSFEIKKDIKLHIFLISKIVWKLRRQVCKTLSKYKSKLIQFYPLLWHSIYNH